MTNQTVTSVENNFTKGLITDSTGLNFPENAATDTDNCEYTLIGDVVRRLGIDKETNGTTFSVTTTGVACSTYKWNNVGGDGLTQFAVAQVGGILYFYNISTATNASPLSTKKLVASIDMTPYRVGTADELSTQECQYTDGNGYLFVFHPACDPFYCTYDSGTLSSSSVTIQIRDFVGTKETPVTDVSNRPTVLNSDHKYNLLNQGWTAGSGSKSGLTVTDNPNVGTGAKVFTMAATGLGFIVGDIVSIKTTSDKVIGGQFIAAGTSVMNGSVTGYTGTTLNVTVTGDLLAARGANAGPYNITSTGAGYIDTWFTATSNYPSNADVWWYYKDATDVFNPASTIANVTASSGPAPRGHYLLNAFNLDRSLASAVPNLTVVATAKRPRTGAWFQGRIWYAGVDDSQAAGGTSDYYTWTDQIYFSQVVTTPQDFGKCYQQNDPTSQQLFDLLPTDGGVISTPGMGAVYKLFPIVNGMLIFASNGVWFLTGSQGIGFAATDYTITKLSSIQSVSGTSFVDVQGLPYFWNDEGIYQVIPQQGGGGLAVQSITVGVLEMFYNEIPLSSKRKARGYYHPLDFTIQWVYKDTEATDITDSYKFNRILNFNVYNKAFFPYSVAISPSAIAGILYVAGPGGTNTPEPMFKYLATTASTITWADEHDDDYMDWSSLTPTDYTSYFVTGYRLRGQAIRKFQVQYIQTWFRTNGGSTHYNIQSIWDFANSGNSGRWSTIQQVNSGLGHYDTGYRRHKVRGHGYALQFKISSVSGKPFDLQGWAAVDTVNTGT
jgi:hypothetical protein